MVVVTKQHQLKKGFFFCNTFSSLLQSLVYINWIYHSSQPFGLSSIKRKVHVFVLFFFLFFFGAFLFISWPATVQKISNVFFLGFLFFLEFKGTLSPRFTQKVIQFMYFFVFPVQLERLNSFYFSQNITKQKKKTVVQWGSCA